MGQCARALFFVASANAQTVIQAEPWTPGHALTYTQGGSSTPLVQDPGPAGGGDPIASLGISELLSVVPPTSGGSQPPWANSGTGPLRVRLKSG